MQTWRDEIESDPAVLRGKPCFKGTRIPVALVLGYLANGQSVESILKEFPDLKPTNISAALNFARDLANYEAA